MSAALLSLLLLSNSALDAAVACYQDLDYVCTEEQLAVALAAGLTPKAQITARLYQAQIAHAHRDVEGARRAIQALLAIDPTYQPKGMPPDLLSLFDSERPPPPPPPRFLARLDLNTTVLFGQDNARWSTGLGVDAGLGVLLDDRWWLEMGGSLSDHRPLVFAFDGLTVTTLDVALGWRTAIGPIRLQLGLMGGALRASAKGPIVDTVDWSGRIGAVLEVSWPIFDGWGVGLRVAPNLVLLDDGERLATSWLLPILIGLRFGP